MDDMQKNEIISALADGQLQGVEFDEGLALASGDQASRELWHRYHLIGDVLRSGEHAAGTLPSVFMGRLQMRLQQEHALPAVEVKPVPALAASAMSNGPAANDSNFRWKMVAGFASVTAVAAIGWSMATGSGAGSAGQAQLAAAPAASAVPVLASAVGTKGGVMLRDPKLDEFLAAHRQLGGASALQMPAGFLRNATYEGAGR